MSILDGRWWTKPWNPIRVKGGGWHCTKISPGCQNCWAEAINIRFGNGMPFRPFFHPIELERQKYPPQFELDQRILEQPLHWKKPRIVAVQWLGDIFHEQIPDDFISWVVASAEAYNWHKYLFLTKRIERARIVLNELYSQDIRPFSHIWLGLSISTQQEADEKIPILLQTPAVHRFVNLEPMLSEINLKQAIPKGYERGICSKCGWGESMLFTNRLKVNEKLYCPDCRVSFLDWILLGAESGPGRRPMKLEWARSIAEQCKAAGVKLWIKQLELEDWANSVYKAKTKVSKNMAEWGDKDLRVRQWPW